MVWGVSFHYLFGFLLYSGLFLLLLHNCHIQSDNIGNAFGHIFTSWVHIAQYLVCSVNFTGGTGEVGDNVDGVSIGWLGVGARLVVAPAASLAFLRLAIQFC